VSERTLSVPQPADDWLDRLLVDDAHEDAASYIDDAGFVARVMTALPPAVALPAWRKSAVAALWAVAGVGLAVTLPGAAVDVAREVFRLFAAKPVALSEIAAVLGVLGLGTWTTAIVAWRRT